MPTWVGDGGDNLASTDDNWDSVMAPMAGDDVTFDGDTGTFPNADKDCTWDIATNLNTVDVQTGYSGSITLTNTMNVTFGAGSRLLTLNPSGVFDANGQPVDARKIDASGSATKTIRMGEANWTIGTLCNFAGSNMTLDAETSTVRIQNTCVIDMAANTSLNNLVIHDDGFGFTTSLTSNLTLAGDFNLNDGTNGMTINLKKIFVRGDLKRTNTGFNQGTTVIEFAGSSDATWSDNATGRNGHDIVINRAGGTLTLSNTLVQRGDVSHTAGTVAGGTSTLQCDDTLNLDMGGQAVDNLEITQNATTLTGDIDINGDFTVGASDTIHCSSNLIKLAGNFTRIGTFNRNTSTWRLDG